MDNQLIEDVVITALEQGIGYWADGVTIVPYDFSGSFVVSGHDFEFPEDTFQFTREDLETAMRTSHIDWDNYDCEDADYVFQMAAFGEIVYG